MSSLAVVADNRYAVAKRRPLAPAVALPLRTSYSANEKNTLPAMLCVTVLHVAALFWMLNTPAIAPQQQPVLAFTVTLMEPSSAQHTVSSAASAATAPAEKKIEPKKVEEVVPVVHAPTTVKKAVRKVAQPSPKANPEISHNSQAQTAVVAPLTPAQFDAAYLNNPKPSYPSQSRNMGEQGSVLLSVYVSEDGRASNIQLKQSSGFRRLDDAALEAVSRWRFAAAKQGERLIASWVQVPVKFVLE